jgi:hypothetical protein
MTINWQDVLITIGSTVGGGTVILGAAAWLIKKVLDTKLTLDIETFKAELQKVAFEHQVRFSTLHTDRAKIIADLYARLVDAERLADRYVKVEAWEGAKERQKAYETTERDLVELFFFVEKNRIYLPEPVCQLLTDFVLTVRTNAISMHIFAPVEAVSDTLIRDRGEVIKEVFESVQGKIPAARKALEAEFRTILGG